MEGILKNTGGAAMTHTLHYIQHQLGIYMHIQILQENLCVFKKINDV